MPNPRLAARYAKSLVDISIEQGQLEPVYADMQFMQRIIKENRELGALLRSPIVNADKKDKILTAVTEGRISPLTASFNKLLVAKGREESLPEIIAAFIKQYKDYKNIHVVQLTTAAPVSEELKNAIVARIRSTSNMQNIELETKIDPNLIGGFVLQAGDKLVDASISYDLRQIAKQFESNEFIYAIR